MAEQYLCEGSGSLWSALRMVARCLDYETDTRQHAGGLSFRLRLYNKGGLMGLTKQSRRHYSVARLFNAAIAHVLSTHTWTTLSVNLDNMTVPHYDRGLLLGLTHHSAGGLWICDGSGSQLLEAEGVLSRGTTYCTQASAVLFEGRDCLHSTLPWSGNRCVIRVVSYLKSGAHQKCAPIISQNNIWDSERYKLNPTNIFFHNNIWRKRRKDARASIRPDIFTAKLAV